MSLTRKLLNIFLFATMFMVLHAQADDQQDIHQLIQSLYREEVRPLACADQNGDKEKNLIVVPAHYFSSDFMQYYRPVCLNLTTDTHGNLIWPRDLRTGEFDPYHYSDSKAEFTKLYIGPPKISGNHASIRTTYDLPGSGYKDFGNFTVFSLIKEKNQWKVDDIELGGHDLDKYNERDLPSIKSIKQYIKQNLIEAEAKRKAAVKKSPR